MTTENSLSNLDGALYETYSLLQNRNSGIGTTRDKSQGVTIGVPHFLDIYERNLLFRNSNICRKIVSLYPLEAAKNFFTVASKNDTIDSDEVTNFFDNLPTGSLRDKLVEASLEARLHGDGFVLLGINDGQDWSEPVDENRLREIRWCEVLYHNEVTPDFSNGIHTLHYWISATLNGGIPDENNSRNMNTIKVHKNRILHLKGHRLFGTMVYDNAGQNDSVLQVMFNAFSNYMQALMSSSAMLADYNIFKYKLKGLAKLVQEGKSDQILERFLTIQLGMSVVKGLAMDAENEDADFISRSYSGVKDITSQLLELMVAETDIPRFKLINDKNDMGFDSGKSTQEVRFEWASAVKAWQVDNWKSHLKYLVKLYFLSKGKRDLTGKFDIDFPSIFEQSPLEVQEMRLKKAEEHEKNIKSGVYTAYEARMSTYGMENWSNDVILNEKISKRLEDEAINPKPEPVVSEKKVLLDTKDSIAFTKDNEYTENSPIEGSLLTEAEMADFSEVSEVDVLNVLEKIVTKE